MEIASLSVAQQVARTLVVSPSLLAFIKRQTHARKPFIAAQDACRVVYRRYVCASLFPAISTFDKATKNTN